MKMILTAKGHRDKQKMAQGVSIQPKNNKNNIVVETINYGFLLANVT